MTTLETPTQTEAQDLLRQFVDLHNRTLQKGRIAFDNRLSAVERGDDVMSEEAFYRLEEWAAIFDELERKAKRDIEDLASGIPIIEDMAHLKGVGLYSAAKVVAMVDIRRARHISSLWRYAGYGVNDKGERDRLEKGVPAVFNHRLKTTCYLIAQGFMRATSPYRDIYDEAKVYYLDTRGWAKGHAHNAALRKMIKVFLAHTWEHWRLLEGLPLNGGLYVIEKLGHKHKLERTDFGWPEIE